MLEKPLWQEHGPKGLNLSSLQSQTKLELFFSLHLLHTNKLRPPATEKTEIYATGRGHFPSSRDKTDVMYPPPLFIYCLGEWLIWKYFGLWHLPLLTLQPESNSFSSCLFRSIIKPMCCGPTLKTPFIISPSTFSASESQKKTFKLDTETAETRVWGIEAWYQNLKTR